MTTSITKNWPTARRGVKDPRMLRSTLTPFAFGCAVLVGAIGCENRTAPVVQSEPPPAPAAQATPTPAASAAAERATAPSEPAPAAAADAPQVDLAKYQAPPQGAAAPPGKPSAAAPARAAHAASAPDPSGAEPTLGAVVNDDAFSTWLQAASPAPLGTPTHVEAVLVAKAPYHCNEEYPHKFKLNAPPPGVTYPEETVRGMQVTPERGVLRIPLQAATPGLVKISGTLSFSVCTDERCLVEKRDLTLDLQVK